MTAYTQENRRADHARLAGEMKSVLEDIVPRSYELCKATPRGAPLPNPLMTVEKVYL